MKKPNIKEEKKIWRLGYKRVVGLDEAGRGPLAGPVVACACLLRIDLNSRNLLKSVFNMKDSKKLSSKQREEFYNILTRCPEIIWGIGRVSEKVIDKINILEATKLAMAKAVQKIDDRRNLDKVDFLILDGDFTLPAKSLAKAGISFSILQKPIIKADGNVFSCMAAGIIAKVTRDRIMEKYHRKFPLYRFDRHKGYPTKEHIKMLRKYGFCKIHRKTFGPVRACKKK